MKDQPRYAIYDRNVIDHNRVLGVRDIATCKSRRIAKLIANALNIYKVRRSSKPAEKRS